MVKTRTGGKPTKDAEYYSDEAIIARDKAANLARDKELGEKRNRDTNIRTAKKGKEQVKLNVVGKEEAFKTAAAAGGVPPGETQAQREFRELGPEKSLALSRARVKAEKEAEKPSGWQNVKGVLSIALNPFSKDKITANVDNQIIAWGLEKAANNPLTTALIATGVIQAASAVTATVAKKTFIGSLRLAKPATITQQLIGTAGAATGVAANTATKKLTGGLLAKAGFTVAAGLFIMKAVETYPFAKFEIAEAMDKLGYARVQAIRENRPDLVESLNQLQEEILNPEGWEYMLSIIPWANIQRAAARNIEAAVAGTAVYNKIIEDMQLGETDDEKWKRVRQEELNMDKAAVDYYNSERRKLVKWELEAKAAAQLAQRWAPAGKTREEEIKARNEDAQFWADQAAKQRELEAEDRRAIADFWTAYRKTQQQIADNNRPSNLNFGLL